MPEWRIPLFDLDVGAEEAAAVQQVILSRWLTMGERVQEFERAFAALCGVQYAYAVCNCTAALHLALRALGVGPGDEVIVPSLTFVATANAVVAAGAEPVFADVAGPDDLSLSPASVAAALTPRTRAIIVVHYAGFMGDVAALRALADERGLALIEDCAHAPGAARDGRAAGAWGDVGCFSFFSNKNLATGEGGMVTCTRPEVAEKLRLLRSHGMTTLTLERHRGHAFSYDVLLPGYNYRMDEMHAALGLVQLEKLARKNERRRRLTAVYREELARVPGVQVPYARAALEDSSCHILPVVLPEGAERTAVMRALAAVGIQTSIHYPPVHTFSWYRRRAHGPLPNTERLAARLLTLPLYPAMREEDVREVCGALGEALAAGAVVEAASA